MPRGIPNSGPKKTAAKRKTAKKAPARKKTPVTSLLLDGQLIASTAPVSEAERQAKLQAYGALKGAGVEIPAELAKEVEGWIAAEKQRQLEETRQQVSQAEIIEKENKAGPWYVRNNYNSPFSLRLERQDKKKRIDLKARGERGDMFPLQDGDLDDPILQTNLNTGLIEVIPAGEAKNILGKQTHNLQRTHVPIDILRNEKGEPYAPENIKLEAEFNSQGVVVAYEQPTQDDKLRAKSPMAGLTRAQGQVPQQVTQFIPGTNPAIVSSGFQQPDPTRVADDLARRRGTVPQLSVVVDPVRRT